MSEQTFLEQMARIHCPVQEIDVRTERFRYYELPKFHPVLTGFGASRKSRIMFKRGGDHFTLFSFDGSYEIASPTKDIAKRISDGAVKRLSETFGPPTVNNDNLSDADSNSWSYSWNCDGFLVSYTAMYMIDITSLQIQYYDLRQK